MLKLRSSPASPFGRKVKVAALFTGHTGKMEILPADTMNPADPLRQDNPLGKSPCLILADGTTVYECTSAEEVVDLLQGGQGVFGIAVSGAMRELTGAIADFPGERADGGESITAPEDELASRRKSRDRKIG